MESSILLEKDLFKQKVLSTTNRGSELVVNDGRFSRIPFIKRWVGWFLSDIEPNYCWKLVSKHLQKQWEKISLQNLDYNQLECLKSNLKKALQISNEYKELPFFTILSKAFDDYLIETQWIENALLEVDETI